VSTLRRLWQGELPLAEAFWTWAVLGGLVVNVTTTIAFLALVMNGYLLAAFIAGYAIPIPYNIFVTFGVWRSAERYEGERKWADLARVVTVAGMILLTIT